MTDIVTCPPEHGHGAKTTCYSNHGCRCTACHDHWLAHYKNLRKLKAYGRYQSYLIDAEPVRDHIANLQREGMSLNTISTAAGLDNSVVCYLMKGRPGKHAPSPLISRNSAEAIMAVQHSLDLYREKSTLDARGSVRRLQALVARGWSLAALGRHMGTTPQRVEQMITADRLTAGVHRRIITLYDNLWDQQPPRTTPGERLGYTRSINRARSKGWVPPVAWDDIDNDPAPASFENDTIIDEIAIDLAMAGHPVELTHEEKIIALRRMHPLRWSNYLIAKHLCCDERTVLRIRKEIELPGWDQTELVQKRAA